MVIKGNCVPGRSHSPQINHNIMSKVTFFCIIEGALTPFLVDIDKNLTIGHLEKAIKVERAITFAHNDADELLL